MSRRPPWDSFRSGSSRKPTSPFERWRSATRSARTPSQGGFCLAQRSRAPSMTGSATLGSPHTTRASSRPSATRRSSPASSRASPGRRTLWSRVIPSSQTGYQIRSAVADTFRRPLWRRTTSRSLNGQSSPAAVPAHGHQGQAPAVAARGLVEQPGQPLVGGPGVGAAEVVSVEIGALDERLPSGAQGHGRTVPPGRDGAADPAPAGGSGPTGHDPTGPDGVPTEVGRRPLRCRHGRRGT